MSREVTIGARHFFIVSEPEGDGWKARVFERLDEGGATRDLGMEADGDTRGLADERAFGALQRLLRS